MNTRPTTLVALVAESTPTPDLSAALRAASLGDEEAFVAVWRAYQPRLLRFLGALVSTDDVADIASVVWTEIVRRFDTFDGDEADFRSWLFTLARRRAIDHHRRRDRRPEELRAVVGDGPAPGGTPEPESILDDEESTETIIALIGTLPRSEAEVVLLRVVADLDVPTTAGIVGKRPGTVRVLSHRGIERLRSALVGRRPVPLVASSGRRVAGVDHDR